MVDLHALLASIRHSKTDSVLSSVDRLVDGVLSNVDRLIRDKVFCTDPKGSAAKGRVFLLPNHEINLQIVGLAPSKLVGCVETA